MWGQKKLKEFPDVLSASHEACVLPRSGCTQLVKTQMIL